MQSNKFIFFNVKLLLLCGRQSRGRKGKLQRWRKYLQTTYPTKDYFLEYIKNSQNSTVKAKQTPNYTVQLENEQKTGTDISLKKIYRFHISTLKDVEHL